MRERELWYTGLRPVSSSRPAACRCEKFALPFYFNNPFTFRGRNSARSSCVVAKAAVTRANHASAMVCRGKRTNIRAAFATTPKRTDFLNRRGALVTWMTSTQKLCLPLVEALR